MACWFKTFDRLSIGRYCELFPEDGPVVDNVPLVPIEPTDPAAAATQVDEVGDVAMQAYEPSAPAVAPSAPELHMTLDFKTTQYCLFWT